MSVLIGLQGLTLIVLAFIAYGVFLIGEMVSAHCKEMRRVHKEAEGTGE